MAITVSDIEQKEFAYKGAGYDPYDVDQYLDQICDEMVEMQEHIDQLEAELAKARRELEVAQNAVQPEPVKAPEPVAETSQTLESILLNAQKLADGAVSDAKRKAEEIVKDAQTEADGILKGVSSEKQTLEDSLAALRASAKDFREKYMAMLSEQQTLLESKASLFEEQADDWSPACMPYSAEPVEESGAVFRARV